MKRELKAVREAVENAQACVLDIRSLYHECEGVIDAVQIETGRRVSNSLQEQITAMLDTFRTDTQRAMRRLCEAQAAIDRLKAELAARDGVLAEVGNVVAAAERGR